MQTPEQMLEDIARDAEQTAEMTGRPRFSEPVMETMARVPRQAFVGDDQTEQAWYNIPLSIGYGQTISQPYIVALMTDLLEPQPDHVCLEVGTGSGYQAAVLSSLVRELYSTERIPQLQRQASERLQRLGYNNIHCVAAEQQPGYSPAAPYDGILVTAAPRSVPISLLAQLRPGGRLVIPVGPTGIAQQLWLICKNLQGELEQRAIIPVRFVPLIIDEPDPDDKNTVFRL